MPEEKLDLIEFAAGQMTQSRTGSPEIVGCQPFDARAGGGATDDVPQHFLPSSRRLVDRAKDAPVRQPRGSGPCVNGGLDPRGHGDCPDVAPLTDELGDDLMLLPLLDGLQGESQRLAPSHPAPEQERDHRVVAESS